MKNRVNLYHPEFHPKLRLLTLPILLVSWLLTALFCGLLYFYVESGQKGIKSEFAKIEKINQQQRILIKKLLVVIKFLQIWPGFNEKAMVFIRV